MSEGFDPYYEWLGIPPKDQPPNHYRLLAIELWECNPSVIEHAADQRMAYLRTFQTGPHAALSQKLLNEVAAAKVCLLNPEKKAAYDAQASPAVAGRSDSPDRANRPARPADPDGIGWATEHGPRRSRSGLAQYADSLSAGCSRHSSRGHLPLCVPAAAGPSKGACLALDAGCGSSGADGGRACASGGGF